jgi:hypothetical protein
MNMFISASVLVAFASSEGDAQTAAHSAAAKSAARRSKTCVVAK